ncbi:MAG: tetratricopeptide repeat protein, partial [Gammaproteobacteria bacterium]|nr:tetratricopeptide repeat protein [Gammaproteobacteria bacterium]
MTCRVRMHHSHYRMPAMLMFAALIFALSAFADGETEDSRGAASEHLLRAETALAEAEYRNAAAEFLRAAEAGESVEIARQATRLAFDYGFDDLGLLAADRWLELDPDSDEARIHLAQIQLRRGELRNATQNFRIVIERGEPPHDERLFSLMGFISQEDAGPAYEVMRSLAKPYGDSALARYSVAAMALQAEDLDAAFENVRLAIELDPEWIKAKLLYARVMLIAGDIDEAIDYTARIIGDDPDPDPDARMELALMYLTADRDDDALSQVNQVLLEHAQRTDALRLMAIINFRQNNLDAAWNDFEDLLASGDFTADALFYLARIADFRGDHDQAIRLYSEVKFGKNAIASQRRASALLAFEMEDPDAALEHLDTFAGERPTYAIEMLLARAQLLSSLGRPEEAIAGFDKVHAYRPDNEAVALGRAELLLRMDRLGDAVVAYRQAAKRWPESPTTLNALGYTLADRTEEFRDAEKFIRKALKYDPTSPAIIDSLGWVLHKRGKHKEALQQLEIAYEQFPDPEVAAHL